MREAEFNDVFAHAVRGVGRPDPRTLALDLEPAAEVAARVANLAVRETQCCSFFTFALTATGGALRLDISVPQAHIDVLEALAARANGVVGPAPSGIT